MNPESRERLPTPVEEDMLAFTTTVNERSQFVNRLWPQRTTAGLVSLSVDENGRGVAVGCDTEVEVADPYLGYLVGPSASVVHEQKYCVVPTALGSATVGRFPQRIHLVRFQVPDQRARDLLRRDALNLTDPFQVFRAVLTDESRQGTNRSETLISCGNPATVSFFQVSEKRPGAGWRYILHKKSLDPPVGGASDERQEL